jgi:hypothetical protein
MVQPSFAAGSLLDAERRMHHDDENDAEALGVIDPGDSLPGCWAACGRREMSVPIWLAHVSLTLSHKQGVMAGLVPAIHVLPAAQKTWMRGTSPRMTVERLERDTR